MFYIIQNVFLIIKQVKFKEKKILQKELLTKTIKFL